MLLLGNPLSDCRRALEQDEEAIEQKRRDTEYQDMEIN